MQVRPYQKDLLAQVLKEITEHGPGSGVGLQLWTGAGKTLIGALALLKFLEATQDYARPHAWVTHRRELSGQSADRMLDVGLPISNMSDFAASDRRWVRGKVNIVSPSLRKWPHLPIRLGLMVVDEAHHTPAATWSRLIEHWQSRGGYVLGLSATWWRLSKRQGFENWFKSLICGPTFEELQKDGYLATPRVHLPQETQIDATDADIMSTGEYSIRWMNDSVLALLAHTPVIEDWNMRTVDLADRRTMWFVPTVHCAQVLGQGLGAASRVLTGETPQAEREMILDDLRNNRITHLISVDVLGEGIDVPSVPIIASLRTTQSLAVWLQQCGRGSRPKSEDGGEYLVIDYAANSTRHGLPDEEREWSLEPRIRNKSLMPQAIVASCVNPECGDIQLHPAHRECWNCGQGQWFECQECHVHRRWTQIDTAGPEGTCRICRDYQKQKKKEAEEAERAAKRARRKEEWHKKDAQRQEAWQKRKTERVTQNAQNAHRRRKIPSKERTSTKQDSPTHTK